MTAALVASSPASTSESPLDAAAAGRFAQLARACIHREYPNKISHVLASDADVRPPRDLTPVFYGCYDWHSSVHGHWLLARLAREYPDAEFTAAAVARRTVVLTTTNGTAAMLAASRAAAAGLAALTNVTAAARWAREEGRDVSILCAGDSGALSLEDVVCAGLLVARLSEPGAAVLSDGAATALALGRYYGARLDRLAEASPWARRLARHDRGADLAACLRIDASDVVPVFAEGGFVPRRVPAAGGLAAVARREGAS